MNSPPARELNNTCRGVASLDTYKILARVVATNDEGQSENNFAGHAQLIFLHRGDEPSITEIILTKYIEH